MEIASRYDPSQVEGKWYRYWLENRFFHSEPDEREPYTVVIPPPNVTGVLHMGHMLNNTIQDILVRRARMSGKNACWVPGTDHASIATEAKVVDRLAQEGIRKTDLTREQFLEHAWEWTRRHGGIILEQLKKLGASCDWERTCFTMDEKRSESVLRVFVDLYNKGWIYRGVRMVNWDPAARTALSDEEVIYREQQGKLYYLRYQIVGEDGYAVVATTRPETILGDTAVCIHPNDPKNARLKGKKVLVPLVGREIPIIEDEYVDIEFGTGCLKVTPAHDINDYLLGEKHHLETIDIFNDDGTLNRFGHPYEGKDRFEVRREIENDLIRAGCMEKVEPYEHKVGFSERTNVPIEPKLSMQWFLKMERLAGPALEAVMNGSVRFYPARFRNIYRHWMENIKDWCISRQLWWGHRIPAWYLPGGGFVVAQTAEQALLLAREKSGNPALTMSDLRQDEDCLDTWFSSWLWPVSVFDGITRPQNRDIAYYYPTNDLVTAPEIIFFWVARMIMSGFEYRGKPCFHNVYFTGIVRDKSGRKMSKSLGNSPDPIRLMERYGADGVRMGMLLASPAGNDLLFDESLCEQGRNFNNKIWNAFRLVKGWKTDGRLPQPETAALAVKWFRGRLNRTLSEMNEAFEKYRLTDAMMMAYKLFWDEFSSWYLELVKPAYEQPVDAQTCRDTLGFFDTLLRLLHPFMPFITEELWQALSPRLPGESVMMAPIPLPNDVCPEETETCLQAFERAKEVIGAVRTIRLQKNLPAREALVLEVADASHDSRLDAVIVKMAHLAEIRTVAEKSAGSVSFLAGTTEYAVPLGGRMDMAGEKARMEAELHYLEGFLASVRKKLGNEGFVAKAKPEVVANERKKQADAESKIRTLKEGLKLLSRQPE
ncbi:MAG: valine--tRNA ligase [Tannerella sp.]|jgi:valyl-tRNA synthetase|nr:valine--tRNA ligase [Tannerella sp.]